MRMPYEIDLINGDGGLFWNRGMYEAIEHAKKAHPDYEYYMLMNDDTKFVPGIFDEMAPVVCTRIRSWSGRCAGMTAG